MAIKVQKTTMASQLINRLEGGLLALLGSLLLFFASGNLYQTLLNPRFSLLSATTGGGCILLGLVLLRWPVRFELVRALSFVAIIALFALVTAYPVQPRQQGVTVGGQGVPAYPDAREEFAPREIMNGQEYVRINLGELFDIAEVGSDQQRQQPYLVRGVLMAAEGHWQPVILRTAISCCLADAVSVGFDVISNQAELPDKQWVNLYGVLVADDVANAEDEETDLPGVAFTTVHTSYSFKAEIIEPITPPEVPFMFEFRQQEPYAY